MLLTNQDDNVRHKVKGSFILTTVSPKPCITVDSVDLFFNFVISLKDELAPPIKAFRSRHMSKNIG